MNTKDLAATYRFAIILLSLFLSSELWASKMATLEGRPLGIRQSIENKTPSDALSEDFLEQVRINSRLQAAGASFNLSVIAAERMNFTRARTLIEEAIQLKPADPNFLWIAAEIAFLSLEYDKAEEYQVKVVEFVRSAREPDDLLVAEMLDVLSAIYVAQELYENAEYSLQDSLKLRENTLGDKHLLVAVSLNKLATLAALKGDPSNAESLLKRSLTIAREVSGPRHVNSATVLETLADLYQSESRFEESELLYEEALSIWIDPLKLANGHTSLGQLFMRQRLFDKARLQFEKVLTLLEENYKQGHPYIQQAINNLAALDAELGSSKETDLMYEMLVQEFNIMKGERMTAIIPHH